MRKLMFGVAAISIMFAVTPASAAVIVLASNVNFAAAPFTFGVTSADRFTLTYAPQGAFDPSPVLVTTTGTAATTSFGGFLGIPLAPSVFFTDSNVVIGPGTFPGFNSFPAPTRADYTITLSDLGLRYTVGMDQFYGYARFAKLNLIAVAFETMANTPITSGVGVPEPASLALFIAGLAGFAGFAGFKRKEKLSAA